MNKLSYLLFIFILGMSTLSAYAQEQGPLVSQLAAEKVITNDKGEERFEEATHAKPGDIIQYQLTYKNIGDKPLSNLTVVGKIPEGTFYVANTAKTEEKAILEVSLDGGKNWATPPLFRDVMQADGSIKKEQITEDQFTQLRWRFEQALLPAQKSQFTYRVAVKK